MPRKTIPLNQALAPVEPDHSIEPVDDIRPDVAIDLGAGVEAHVDPYKLGMTVLKAVLYLAFQAAKKR